MIKEQLLSKNGTATMKLSKELLKYSIGDRIPTITEFSQRIDLARGTIQNALKNLINAGAIKIESRGHLGSYCIKKNSQILLDYAGINNLVGAMPLPYSKRYEGIASGIIISTENKNKTPVNIAFMRGSKQRMSMVESGRYDFAIVSRFTAEKYIKENGGLKIILSFGEGSFSSKHVLMFHDQKIDQIEDGMKVGIDPDSFDQVELTKMACKGKDVEYVPVEYSRMIQRIMSGDVDATVMNVDEVLDKNVPIHFVQLKDYSLDNTEAVIVASLEHPEIELLLKELIDVQEVLNIQKLVLQDKIIPSY